jgi:hypothetical protein
MEKIPIMIKSFFVTVLVLAVTLFPHIASGQITDPDALLVDIPEPPGARSELPSPVPMVYQFMGAMMDGEYDTCLANFDVETFLVILFGRQLQRMSADEYRELYSFQVQTHRNEFMFLSRIMNRVANGAKISYSDPRYHQKVQSKVVIRLDTNRGRFEFVVYCRYNDGVWRVYDYVLNNQRLTRTFKGSLGNTRVDTYVSFLRPFYEEKRGFRPIRNAEYDFAMMVPSKYQIRENVSDALLASVDAFDGQFLLHVQATRYDEPQNLKQVGKAIKETLMPFSPRLYDQWKSELAGIEFGNVLFHFFKNKKRLYTHMVIIPIGRKLIVLNFYHSSLALMKHMTNIRESVLQTLALPKLESIGGVLPGEIPDELTLDAGNELGLGDEYGFEESSDVTLTPDNGGYSESSGGYSDYDYSSSEIPPPTSEEQSDMLTPDSYIGGNDSDSGYSDYPEPPPPPPVDDYDYYDDDMITDDDDEVPPPPPGSYGDGSGTDSDDYDYYGNGSEVSF